MAFQTGANVQVAIKRETTIGTAATAAGATVLRITDSPGMELRRAVIQSNEKRDDMLRAQGRLGGKSVEGSYNSELSVGGATTMLFESIMRSAWVTSFAVGYATMTGVVVGTNQVVATAGSWLTQGIRTGDVFRLSGTTEAANHNLNKIVTAVTTLTISVATGSFTAKATEATGTVTVLRKVANATTPTRYSHTIEQYDEDVDLSELFLGCRLTGMRLSFRPGQMATAQYTFMGMDRTALATGTSPWFTSPTLTTGLGLVADDSSIRYNGKTVATFTGFDLDFQISAAGQPVIGSFISPDIFDNDTTVTGSVSGVREDFANLTLFDAETEFEMSILLEEPNGPPKDCIAIFLPRVKISGLSAPAGGSDGAKIETLQLMVGPKVAATGFNAGVCTISTSGL